jgi:hypothetical protein
MRAKEFIIEDSTIPVSDNRLSSSVARSLPSTYSIPALPNSDFYKQYRFGVAIAGARSAEQRLSDSPGANMAPSSAWGENEIIIGYDLDTDIIDYALNIVGLKSSDKKLISTKKSEEMSEVDTKSPIQSFKGYER